MRCKLLALDMDGTLLDRRDTISMENQIWIQKALDAGVHIVLSTGRSLREAEKYAAQLQLTGPLIVNNGSEVWKKPGELHSRYLLTHEQITEIMEVVGDDRRHIHFWAHALTGSIYSAKEFAQLPLYENWMQVGIQTNKAEWLQQISYIFRSWDTVEVSQSHPDNIELNAKGRSKGAALLELCDLLGIAPEQTIAVGDGCNDIAAFKAAGLGIAMGNAPREVKQAADYITVANYENGVAEVIKQFIVPS